MEPETNTTEAAQVTTKTITLPSGRIAELKEFKGKHIREAQRIAEGDSERIMFAIIAMLVTIDGKPVVMEDMDDMPGGDVLKLMAEFGDGNF